ncbi:MAG: N-acetyl-gamma-glutamyl-phosphate reductase [Armatimonadota bacterium]|nr:N-acetyl-gamma-glutamyl-phosphate reductase [Armatimonadota bacterium]MDR5697183.1 N-acetyl-gamma-glutamyl-phosphate reductase [Armatimonadota bacterium]
MIRVSVAGASGYTGGEVVRWLSRHPRVQIRHLAAAQQQGRSIEAVFPNLRGVVRHTLEGADWHRIGADSEVVFLALPHEVAIEAAPEILRAGARVVDLGAGFRLRDPEAYVRWYGFEHRAAQMLGQAVYGLPEFWRSSIRSAQLVASPGCYPTAAVLAIAPLAQAGCVSGAVVVDAKSGVSGAGRAPAAGTHFGEVNENVRPYNVGTHRHVPEMEQALSALGCPLRVFFAPHLIPMTRGILANCYVTLAKPLAPAEAVALYREAYDAEPFVRVLTDELPQTKATYGSNFCDVAVRVDAERRVAVAIAALDNLGKGAAGQAIQSMNLMCGLPEEEGLWAAAVFP